MRFLRNVILEIFSEYIIYSRPMDGRDAQDASSTSQQTGIALSILHMQYIAILQCSAVASGLHMGCQSHFHCQ